MISTILVYLKKNSALKTHLFIFWFYPNQGALTSWLVRFLWRHFNNKLYHTTSKQPAKKRDASTFIRIKPNKKSKKVIIIQTVFVGRILVLNCIQSCFLFFYIVVLRIRVQKELRSSLLAYQWFQNIVKEACEVTFCPDTQFECVVQRKAEL